MKKKIERPTVKAIGRPVQVHRFLDKRLPPIEYYASIVHWPLSWSIFVHLTSSLRCSSLPDALITVLKDVVKLASNLALGMPTILLACRLIITRDILTAVCLTSHHVLLNLTPFVPAYRVSSWLIGNIYSFYWIPMCSYNRFQWWEQNISI